MEYLTNEGKIDVFAFVLMPNHIQCYMADKRIEWKRNGTGFFFEYTAHEFRKMLLSEGGEKLSPYKADAENKKHEFWKRDSLAIHLYSREVAFQN